MAMKCPKCGAENSDDAEYCGGCAQWLKETPRSTVSESTSPASVGTPRVPAYERRTSLTDSPLSLASLALTISLILLSVGFVLQIYGNERYLQIVWGDRPSIDELQSINNVFSASEYASSFGDISAIVGLVFIVQAFVAYQIRGESSIQFSLVLLKKVRWLLILTAALLTTSLIISISVGQLHANINSSLYTRLMYLSPFSWLVVVVSLLAFALAFRGGDGIQR